MTGMETLLKTFLKVAGFEPESFVAGLRGFIDQTQGQLKSFDMRLTAAIDTASRMEEKQDEILRNQRRIMAHMVITQAEVIEHDFQKIGRDGTG